ncbi:MAG: YicC/YloC family endoribonuclease, partial [Vicinamibacterales bacterium]|nr:YicC/YloC family endoribonuclease [Vicinamibacterales bacterium]
MIKSMTGFANQSHEDTLATVSVTVRTVNHRYLDVQLRIPSSLSPVESRLRTLVQQHVARG